jgi:exonuclease SbcC
MRPIALDMHGFASFREPTRVDFGDADFFALVGSTGSGKSTVIDAMTFALYGSVPRWGRKGMVSLALAPTVARGTVKLVFEVDRQRYVAARELRRVGGKVGQRAASLERLADPRGLAAPGDDTVPLAKDVDGVTEAVERLLGLSYEDFIQCVVLPQGQFADFLHAKPGDRQAILLRLLGADHYKQMMMAANQRASAAELRAETIGETLRGYADATADAETAAVEAEKALVTLGERVTATLPRIVGSQRRLTAAEDRLRTLRAEHAALTALRVPGDAAAIDADLAAARTALGEAKSAEEEAETADTAARDALGHGPERAPLELARVRRAERNRLQQSVPGLTSDSAERKRLAGQASAAVESAAAGLETLRERRDESAAAAAAVADRVRQLTEEHDALAAVTVPGGIAALDSRRNEAQAGMDEAARALEVTEEAEAAARQARNEAVPAEPLLQTRGELGQLHEVLSSLAADRRAALDAREDAEAADADVTAAEETLRQRRETLDELRRAHVIAGLRPHLVAGEPCPLCEQTVATLPADSAGPGPEGTAARAAMEEADRTLKRAQAIARSASSKAARADSALESGVTRGTALLDAFARTLEEPLAGAPVPAARELASVRVTAAPGDADAPATGEALAGIDSRLMIRVRDEIGALLKQRTEAERAADRAAKAAEAARARHRQAQARREQADGDLTAARNALRAARDPLVRFGAPQAGDDASLALARAWTDLSEWAAGQARDRAAALTDARRQAGEAAGETAARAKEFGAAERTLAGLRDQAKRAAAEEQQASARLTHVTSRAGELDGLLEGAPDEEQITAQLAELDRRKTGADKAAALFQRARAARGTAETALAGRMSSAQEARAALSAARDRVVALGAPPIDGTAGLLDGWTMLVTWAGEQAAARDRLVEEVTGEAGAAREETGRLTGQLTADLAGAGIVLGTGADAVADAQAVIDGAQAAVAKERERARGALDRIRERRAAAAGQLGKQQAALDEQRVARMLGDLLRADHFQRWLVTAALDDLVTHASRTLVALSSGQFDLTYDGGDFYVIDHADADTRRSVRTLSGGETFQASLALALALSSQISALAAAGAARLDSIFLDEGFGTLDPETLEVVATTLETLAQGDRMVGVVTHVGALAERVPVRFRVSRNARTSLVTREGLDVTPDVTEDAFPS